MEAINDFIKILLPAALVLLAMYLTVKALVERRVEKADQGSKFQTSGPPNPSLLAIRMQAFERLVLYLERIHPENLLLRINRPGISNRDLQQMMLNDIREEYGHNLAQQIYVSEKSWNLLKDAKEEINILINRSADQVNGENRSMELARVILEELMRSNYKPTEKAISQLKAEARQLLG
jgi:hypothetical protein